MNENAKYEIYKKKLQGICDENNLSFKLSTSTYPITMTIQPLSGLDNQMTMLEMADSEPFNSPDAKMVFSYMDGDLTYKMSERFTISDALFSKVKNLFKNLHLTYLMFLHRQIIENCLIKDFPQPVAGGETEEAIAETMPAEDLFEETDDDIGAVDLNEAEDGDEEAPVECTFDEYLIKQATEYAHELGEIACNDLVKKFNLSFSHAARLMAALEDAGVVGEYAGTTGKRAVIEALENE